MATHGNDPQFRLSIAGRGERQIAVGRLVLALLTPAILWLDPVEPANHTSAAFAVSIGYILYSLLFLVAIWRLGVPGRSLGIVAHCLDLAVFALFTFFSADATSPFFVYFVFAVSAGATRWEGKGAFLTTLLSLALVVVMVFVDRESFSRPALAPNSLTIRGVYLAIVGLLLWYLSSHEARQRKGFLRLALWPVASDVSSAVPELLKHAAWVLRSPRILLCWEDEEEPWINTGYWDGEAFKESREAPDAFGTLVNGRLLASSFVCHDASARNPVALYIDDKKAHKFKGEVVDRELRRRFAIGPVLGLRISTENLHGYVFALDMTRMTTDELALGGVASDEIGIRLNEFYLVDRLKQNAVNDERIRLARDLHDGLFQSLTGAALQLESVAQLLEVYPDKARERLTGVQALISAEQRDLRQHIHSLRPATSVLSGLTQALPERLDDLAKRMERHWGIRASVGLDGDGIGVPDKLAREVYFIVHESMINAARHARASSVDARIGVDRESVRMMITDNGRGFPFQGRFDHAFLQERGLGPRTLRERIVSLGGSLDIDSSENGSTLEVKLPMKRDR